MRLQHVLTSCGNSPVHRPGTTLPHQSRNVQADPFRFAGIKNYPKNQFQPAERAKWPQRFQYLTPQHQRGYIYFMTAEHRRELLHILDKGIRQIQAGRFQDAISTYYNPKNENKTYAHMLIHNVPVTPQTTREDIERMTRDLEKEEIFPSQGKRFIRLIRFTPQGPLKNYNRNFLKALAVTQAHIALEEWLHYLQYAIHTPISRQFAEQYPGYREQSEYDPESDITAFLIEQNIPLPKTHFSNHRERKEVFPHWEQLLQRHSEDRILL